MNTTTFLMIIPLFIFMCLPAVAQQENKEAWNNRQCAVVLTYDDGLHVHIDKVIPVLDSLGLKATFYIPCNSSCLSTRMEEWRTVAAHGHELGNHSLFHPCVGKSKGRNWVKPEYDLDTYTVTRMVDEIRLANIMLRAIDGKTNRTFAYTCGDKAAGGASFVDSIQKDFSGARGTRSGMNMFGDTDLMDIKSYMINGQSADEMIDLVKTAEKEGALVVFLFHGVGGEHAINVNLADHNKLLEYLGNRKSTIWVAPLNEISSYMIDH